MTNIPLCVPNISGQEGVYLAECVSSTFVSSVGPFVDRFEAAVRDATEANWAVATSAGTTGLHAVLHFLGVGPTDHVIIPSLTFIATANAVAHCHATPIILDVDQSRWGLDANLLSNLLESQCRRDGEGRLIYSKTGGEIKAVLPVYAMGLPADMDTICSVARHYGLPVVADAAAAIGATYEARALAEIGADYTVMSFNGNKVITAGGGGAIVSANNDDGARIKHLTTTARAGPTYDHDAVGFNYRMTNLQAAVGVAQMERLEEFLKKKKYISEFYADAFDDLDEVLPFPSVKNSTGSNWLSGAYLPNSSIEKIDSFRRALGDNKIENRTFWKPIHNQTPFRECPKVLTGRSDELWQRIQPLPCSTQITKSELARVVRVVRSTFAGNG